MIRVIDNFVNSAYYDVIEKNMLINFVWSWTDNITGGTSNMFGFSHKLFDAGKPTSPFYEFLLPAFLQAQGETDAEVLLRARGDMTVISEEQITHIPHIDMPMHKEHINMIFYIGDSDGDTIIYKEKFFPQTPYVEPKLPKTLTEEQRVTPKANRLVIFNGEHWHTGQSPKEHSRRVILNLNFAKDDYRIN
tara:strand:- start:400 stop:972 length:573 start_codon:yes stop_codon:yes gene_type:complete